MQNINSQTVTTCIEMLVKILKREAVQPTLDMETNQQMVQKKLKTGMALLEIRQKLFDLVHDGLDHEGLNLDPKIHQGETA